MTTNRARSPPDPPADEGKRVLYIATKRKSAPLKELFNTMHDDMTSAVPVELIIDRRTEVSRKRFDYVNAERRLWDRRQYRELNALARNGWARIVVDSGGVTEAAVLVRETELPPQSTPAESPPPGTDPNRVTLHSPAHLRYWSIRLGCRPDRLKAAVRVAGSLAVDVEQYLRRGR